MKLEYISTFYSDIASVSDYLEDYPQKAKRLFEKMDIPIQLIENN